MSKTKKFLIAAGISIAAIVVTSLIKPEWFAPIKKDSEGNLV